MNIISIDGGGILGLSSLSYLASLEKHFGINIHDHFDMFCGTSTGAIIALGLASGISANELKIKYKELAKIIFPKRLFEKISFLKQLVYSNYDNKVIKEYLKQLFGDKTVSSIQENNKLILIPAMNISNGFPRIFKTDHSDEFGRDGKYLLSDIALASASAPTYFPILNLSSNDDGPIEKFIDGGLFANNPALLGFIEANCQLGVNTKNIFMLSVSTPRNDLSDYNINKSVRAGLIHYRKKLIDYPLSASSDLTHQILLRLFKKEDALDNYIRIDFNNPNKIRINSSNLSDLNALENIGQNEFHQSSMKKSLKKFLKED